MNVTKLEIAGLVVFEPRAFSDDRGFFFESFNDRVFREATGFTGQFVQDNQSVSRKGVVRGLHYQLEPHAQGKLVRVTSGGAPVEFRTYPGADHAFDNDDFVNHDPDASAQAWAATTEWLARTLPVG